MTERLYYEPSPPRSFEATILRVEPRDRYIAVWLDRTAFYPTSGGQPHDLGTLDGVPIVDVVDDESGDVVHVIAPSSEAAGSIAADEWASRVGGQARGEIDWDRRIDHMQQHTGQHVLSAVLDRLFGARTVSFHLGAEICTIDLERELTAAQLAEGEREANRVVWDNRPITIRYASEAEARGLPLRKESARSGTLRLIDIDGVDLSACGGTHVDRTGVIGQIALGSWERFKGGQRVEFLCGARALRRHQQLRDASAASIRLLSVLPNELPAGIERMQGELREQRKALAAAQTELAHYEAIALADAAEAVGASRAVLREIDGDANRLKALAAAIAVRPGLVVVLVSSSSPALAVAARSADVDVSCQAIVAALTKQFGGRGGGRPELAQCGGLQAAPSAILDSVRQTILGDRR